MFLSNMLTPKTTYSALEQIEQRSNENSINVVDKRAIYKNKIMKYFELIDDLDEGTLNHKTYANILISWKQKHI